MKGYIYFCLAHSVLHSIFLHGIILTGLQPMPLEFLVSKTMGQINFCFLQITGLWDSNIEAENGVRQRIGTKKWGCCYIKYLKKWKWLWSWVMGRGWKNFEEQARKSLYCNELSIKDDSGEGSLENLRTSESRNLLRNYLSGCDQNVSRNIDGKGNSYHVSNVDKAQGIGN